VSNPKMSSGIIKPKDEVSEGEQVDTLYPEILVNPDLMGDAVDGENREHEMGMWAAAKSHPWACLWAFIMCFTIVSLP
jgi:SP family general alpha glucoside:H+ symporter-like MFS transporter